MKDKPLANIFFSPVREKRCPNRDCEMHSDGGARDFLRKGYYVTKWNAQPVRRYACRRCGRTFSAHTFRPHYRQHRPDLNQSVFKLYVSGVTQRRMALVLGVNRKTIARKFLFLARRIRLHHRAMLRSPEFVASQVQFDEMETFEHTRLKPVTIALAVNATNGVILDLRAAQLNYKGKLAGLAYRKYGPRPSRAHLAIRSCLRTVKQTTHSGLRVTTDFHPAYPSHIRSLLPAAHHYRTLRVVKERTSDRSNKGDELFTLNYICAKLRNDLSRLGRKTWVTTKKIKRLQAHLDLYLAWNNRYQIAI